MHPLQLGPVADQRVAERRAAAAARQRAAAAAAVVARVPIRHKAGWALVQIGLRLALSSADA